MSLYDYQQSQQVSSEYGFTALLMAAMRRADDVNLAKLGRAFPDELMELMGLMELKARYNAPEGIFLMNKCDIDTQWSDYCDRAHLQVKCDKKCTWSNSEGSNEDDYDTQWETSCGGSFILNDGTPESNEINYCCYCGKPINQLVEE